MAEKRKVRIKLRSTDHRLLDRWVKEIIEIAKGAGQKVVGPVPLPTKRSLFTVLRSPHVNKKSREQFEMRIHKRLIDIINPSARMVDSLTKLNLPAGIDVEIEG